MSIYRQCSDAVRALSEAPPEDLPFSGVFTEIDIVNKTQDLSGDWGHDKQRFKTAARNANQVVGTKFRERKLCRYGPVALPDGSLDYLRLASKIVYADAQSGPAKIKTPNGTFPKMMIEDDPITHQGRRIGTNRDDSTLWTEQDITVHKTVEKTNERIQQERDAAVAKAQELQEKLRTKTEDFDSLLELVGELDARIQWLETQEAKRAKAYAA